MPSFTCTPRELSTETSSLETLCSTTKLMRKTTLKMYKFLSSITGKVTLWSTTNIKLREQGLLLAIVRCNAQRRMTKASKNVFVPEIHKILWVWWVTKVTAPKTISDQMPEKGGKFCPSKMKNSIFEIFALIWPPFGIDTDQIGQKLNVLSQKSSFFTHFCQKLVDQMLFLRENGPKWIFHPWLPSSTNSIFRLIFLILHF